MKNNIFVLLLVSTLFSINITAQTETGIASKIDKVKVFKHNAEITRDLSYRTSKGTQEIVLTGISTSIIPSSLQIQFSNSNSVLLSAKYERNYLLSVKNNKSTEIFQNQLDILNEELALIKDKKTSLEGVESILNKNQDLGNGNSSFTAQQVIDLSRSYEAKYLQVRKSLRDLSKKEKPLKEKINKLKNQLNEANAKFNNPTGNIILQISSRTSKPVKIKCKYIVNNAGWNPIYDIRSKGISKNIKLNYKANIYQNTGINWENVGVTISTGNPSQNNNRPILGPLYANIYERMNNRYDKKKSVMMKSANLATTNFATVQQDQSYKERSEISENQLNVDFNIISKQTVNSDGKENLVALKSYELETEYIYHSVPKLNKGAFLIAKISNWSKFNLIRGKANIFFEGGFVGTSQINPEVTANSLLISLGLDNSIVVERLPIKDFSSSKFIGRTKKETIGYELIVKNKKSTPIKIEILDQIPISQNKSIEVSLEEKGSAEYTKDLGKLLWTMVVRARETKKEKFIYVVKYPKKESIIGIK